MQKGTENLKIEEAFVSVPLSGSGKSEHSMVYFFSDYNHFFSESVNDSKHAFDPLLLNTVVND